MNKFFKTAVFLFANVAHGFKPYRRASVDLAKIKMSLMNIKGIETFRLLFVSALGIGICLVLLLSGLLIFHATLLLYTPWTDQTKMYVGLFFGGLYLLAAVGAFLYIFSQAKWLQIFHAEKMVDDLMQKNNGAHRTEEQRAAETAQL